MSESNKGDVFTQIAGKNYTPTEFEQPTPRYQEKPVKINPSATLGSLFAAAAGTVGRSQSNALAVIQPVIDALSVKNVITLSANDDPALMADYVIVANEHEGNYFIIPILLTKTIRVEQTPYQVKDLTANQVFVPRLPAEVFYVENVLRAIVRCTAKKLNVDERSVKLVLNEYYLSEDFGRLTTEEVTKIISKFIDCANVSFFTLTEAKNNFFNPETVRTLGYSDELKVISSNAHHRDLRDVYGQKIPADHFIEVRVERTLNNEQANPNDRDSIYRPTVDSFTLGNGAILLDLVYSTRQGKDGVVPTQFLQPNIVLTQTNLNDNLGIQGLGSKLIPLLGALIYARSTGDQCEATWFNMAIDQQHRFEQSATGKSRRGISTNWQTLTALVGDRTVVKFSSLGDEMAEVLLDDKNGYVWRDPIFSIDLSRGSNSGAADAILLDILNGDHESRNMLLGVMDNMTDGVFSHLLGNAPIFENEYQMIVPDGTGDFRGEVCSLRELTLPAIVTHAVDSGDLAFVETWMQYQASGKNNSVSAYASVRERTYAGMCVNQQSNANYIRAQFTPEFMSALANSVVTRSYSGNDKYRGFTMRDVANLRGFGNVGNFRSGGRSYGSGNVSFGGVSTGVAPRGAYGYNQGRRFR